MPRIFQLVYVSSSPTPFTPDELGELLTRSRARNEAENITGLLLHADGNFMQAIEGERQSVVGLFERIKRDRRHRNFITLLTHEIAQRDFAEWSMGFRSFGTDTPRPEGFSEFFHASLDLPTAAPKALKLLHLFRANAR
jgi:hypothetical protein